MELAFDLINSEEWYGRGEQGRVDHLAGAEGLAGFLGRWGFADVDAPTPAQRKQLLRLRAMLRRMVTALAGGDAPSGDDFNELGHFLAGQAFRRRVEPEDDGYRLDLAPVRRDWAWVLSEIASSFARLVAEGERERVKLCDNPECRWAFYDTTKNRRRRWCDATECGNLFKVRQFRARQRAKQSTRGAP
jgi:predicted RNA-binding Zn ribbon-like protein